MKDKSFEELEELLFTLPEESEEYKDASEEMDRRLDEQEESLWKDFFKED
jgi:hypothetical protein